MSHNQYFVTDLFTGQVIDEVTCVGASYSKKINAAGEFKGNIPATTTHSIFDLRRTTTPGNRGLYVMRSGVPVWGGIVWDREYDQPNASFQISALGFESYLYHRVIWRKRSYTSVDIFEIVRDLIKAIQVDFNPAAVVRAGSSPYFSGTTGEYNAIGRPTNGDINIVLGTNTMGVQQTNDEDFRGSELKFVGDAINDMTDNQNEFEWRIDPTFNSSTQTFGKTLVLYQPEANGDNAILTFEFPGNIASYKWSDTMEDAATRYWVTGAGDGPDKRIAQWSNDPILNGTLSDTKHDYANFPLYDEVDSSSHGSTKDLSRLAGYAQTKGQHARPPIQDWDVTVWGGRNPAIGSYTTGQWARFIIDDPAFGPVESFARRIEELTVTIPDEEEGAETVDLVLTNRGSTIS